MTGPRVPLINERWRLRPRAERLNERAVRMGNAYVVPRYDVLQKQEEDLWSAMRTGEAYQGRPKVESPSEYSNRMVGDLGRGLLTGRYSTPESMIVGQGIENIPVVGDIGTGVRDTGIGLAHTVRGLLNPEGDQELRGGLAEIGMGVAAALPAVPSMRSLLSRSKALGVTAGTVPEMRANARALEALRPVEANPTPLQRAGVPEQRFNIEQHENNVFSLTRETPHGHAIMSINDNGQVRWSNLPLEDQGKGLGSQMYIEAAQEAERRGTRLSSDTDLTEQAKNLWERFRKEGFAEELGENRYRMKPQSEWPDYEIRRTTSDQRN